jgi:hypothetical protein
LNRRRVAVSADEPVPPDETTRATGKCQRICNYCINPEFGGWRAVPAQSAGPFDIIVEYCRSGADMNGGAPAYRALLPELGLPADVIRNPQFSNHAAQGRSLRRSWPAGEVLWYLHG